MSVRSDERKITASRWGWIAIGFTVASVIGYLFQLTLDHVDEPAALGEFVFYGLFAANGILGLLSGVVAIATGWGRDDSTVRFGVIAIAWLIAVQTLQSMWD
jgi:hypothetical protein